MTYKTKRSLRYTAMVLVTFFFGWLSVFTFQHQSSAAFELGVFFMVVAMFHWTAWPEIEKEDASG